MLFRSWGGLGAQNSDIKLKMQVSVGDAFFISVKAYTSIDDVEFEGKRRIDLD